MSAALTERADPVSMALETPNIRLCEHLVGLGSDDGSLELSSLVSYCYLLKGMVLRDSVGVDFVDIHLSSPLG